MHSAKVGQATLARVSLFRATQDEKTLIGNAIRRPTGQISVSVAGIPQEQVSLEARKVKLLPCTQSNGDGEIQTGRIWSTSGQEVAEVQAAEGPERLWAAAKVQKECGFQSMASVTP